MQLLDLANVGLSSKNLKVRREKILILKDIYEVQSFEEALSFWTQLSKNYLNYGLILNIISIIDVRIGNNAKARAELLQAVKINPRLDKVSEFRWCDAIGIIK